MFTFEQMKRLTAFTCERVALTLRIQHSSNETVETLAIPEISPVTSLPSDGEIVTMMIRKGMLPADAHPDEMTFREDDINVLIKSDFYWDVATGSITSLTLQITAVETLVRWTIQGSLHSLIKGSGVHATSLFIAMLSKTPPNVMPPWRRKSIPSSDSTLLLDSL